MSKELGAKSKSIYASPLRVYLCLGALALVGIVAGLKLPVSLFPNSSKPFVSVSISYGSSSPEDFLNSYGRNFENQLHAVSAEGVEVDKLTSHYDQDHASFDLEFKWGVSPQAALKEVQVVANSYAAQLPEEMRDSLNVRTDNENSGFFAASFYSPSRSLDDVYETIEPVLGPQIAKVKDATDTDLWNPSKKEISIELDPQKMAALQLFPKDVSKAITNALTGQNGGSLTVGTQQLSVQMPRQALVIDDLSKVLLTTPSGGFTHLQDISKIDFGLKTSSSKSFKTSGAPSIVLWASPKPGGNMKRMAEDLIQIIEKSMPTFPKDIQYRVLVDPSEFIRASVHNVFKEVLIGALLAVIILFLFIGSFKNTVTAAIEIPLSMVLAFILMRLSGMNLNIVSLGGLALSAGMNVDASVVVMENIFRHFEETPKSKSGLPLSFKEKLDIITQAVSEVRFAVIASTISSLVVFLPLAFTSDLSYAILGDLAKTVVFSHGFSMFVALILVPTVRLQLMSGSGLGLSRKAKAEKPMHSPIEGWIQRTETFYARTLGSFIASKRAQWITYTSVAVLLVGLAAWVLPRLPTEIIGKPDTDWMYLGIRTKGNTLVKQMESQADQIEAQLLKELGPKVQYTFAQIGGPNRSFIMARLNNKSEMHEVWKRMETVFANTPFYKFDVGPWNPAELPIPDPPAMRIALRGGTLNERALAAQEISDLLESHHIFDRIRAHPDVERAENIILRPKTEQWLALQEKGVNLNPYDLSDLARVATTGRRVGIMPINGRPTDIMMRYPENYVRTAEDLSALPIGIKAKLIPLKALANVTVEAVPPTLYREDQRDVIIITGRQNEGTEKKGATALKEAQKLLADWKPKTNVTLNFEDAEEDLHEALKQLSLAVLLSILLILMTLVIQFGDVVNAVLVLVAVPLGFVGVLSSLYIFKSTLSLNSVLGVILLNGIAVANSIILVDFLKRLVDQGRTPTDAAIEAGRKRLRPILITSLTTILGMLPIALGMGEGGKILQPLGIAVSGGLWVSMTLTLYIVPALQVRYLNWKLAKHPRIEDLTFEAGFREYPLSGLQKLPILPNPGRSEHPPVTLQ